MKIRRLGLADHVIWMEEDRIPKKVLNGKFHNANRYENQEQDGRRCPEGRITNPRNTTLKELGIDKNGGAFGGRQGPGGGA